MALLFETTDGRWRVESTRSGAGFTLVEKQPGGGLFQHLTDVTLAEVGEFLAARGYGPEDLRPA